jgi:hypothetical protein
VRVKSPAGSHARRCLAMGKRRPRRPSIKGAKLVGRPPTSNVSRPQSATAATAEAEVDLNPSGEARKCTLCNIINVGTVRGRKQHYCSRCSNYRAAVHKYGLRTKDVRKTVEQFGIDLTNHEFVEHALSLRPDLDPRASTSHESDGTDDKELIPQQRRNRGVPARANLEGYGTDASLCQICQRSTTTDAGRARRMCLPCSRIRARLAQEGMTLQVCASFISHRA